VIDHEKDCEDEQDASDQDRWWEDFPEGSVVLINPQMWRG
jgi:hypothetical protein